GISSSMSRIQTWSLLLVLSAGSLEAWWFYNNPKPTTESPMETTTVNGTTPSAVLIKEGKEEGNLSQVGEEILKVATGIRKFVDDWDPTATAWTTSGGLTRRVEAATPNITDKTGRLRGEREEQGSWVGEGGRLWSSDDLGSSLEISRINTTSTSPCFPVPSDWPICKQLNFFSLPNFFNHTSVEEAEAVLREWVWLARAGCHHSTEWFLCLLLAPRCPLPAAHLPCRSLCHMLQDSCWASLENGRLPVDCHFLPEREQGYESPGCATVSNRKGNPGGLECILSSDTFRIWLRCLCLLF
ncbi:hypothetical protein GOODEAATRI_005357, partial [Goodea atripinnis]